MFGKNKKKKGILALSGQAYIDAYNKQMTDTGKTTLAQKYKFTKERAILNKRAIKNAGN